MSSDVRKGRSVCEPAVHSTRPIASNASRMAWRFYTFGGVRFMVRSGGITSAVMESSHDQAATGAAGAFFDLRTVENEITKA